MSDSIIINGARAESGRLLIEALLLTREIPLSSCSNINTFYVCLSVHLASRISLSAKLGQGYHKN